MEFVEIYNSGKSLINVADWHLKALRADSTVGQLKVTARRLRGAEYACSVSQKWRGEWCDIYARWLG